MSEHNVLIDGKWYCSETCAKKDNPEVNEAYYGPEAEPNEDEQIQVVDDDHLDDTTRDNETEQENQTQNEENASENYQESDTNEVPNNNIENTDKVGQVRDYNAQNDLEQDDALREAINKSKAVDDDSEEEIIMTTKKEHEQQQHYYNDIDDDQPPIEAIDDHVSEIDKLTVHNQDDSDDDD